MASAVLKEFVSSDNFSPVPVAGASNNIAFSALMSHANQVYLPNEVVQFDMPLVNSGRAFDPVSSKFTCPVAGIYEFRVQIHAVQFAHAQVAIDIDGAIAAELFAGDAGFEGTASTSVVYSCAAGGTVKVIDQSLHQSQILGLEKSLFSGKLLETNEGCQFDALRVCDSSFHLKHNIDIPRKLCGLHCRLFGRLQQHLQRG